MGISADDSVDVGLVGYVSMGVLVVLYRIGFVRVSVGLLMGVSVVLVVSVGVSVVVFGTACVCE